MHVVIACGGKEERDWGCAPSGGGVSLWMTDCVIAGCVVLCEVLSSLLQTLQPHTLCVKFNVLLSVQFC